jgi:hypothetical protein
MKSILMVLQIVAISTCMVTPYAAAVEITAVKWDPGDKVIHVNLDHWPTHPTTPETRSL